MTFTLSHFAQTVLEDQPLEIQCLIIKNVIMNYMTEYRGYFTDAHYQSDRIVTHNLFEKPLAHLTSLFGIHPMLDDILAVVVQDLVFESDIIFSNYICDFEEFVSDRGLKIHITTSTEISLDYTGDELFDIFGEIHVDITRLTRINDTRYLSYATSLKCNVNALGNILNSVDFTDMPKLKKLTIVLKLADENNFDDLKEMLAEIKSWRHSSASNTLAKKHLILLLSFSELNSRDPTINVGSLIDLNQDNDFEIGIDPLSFNAKEYPSISYYYPSIEKLLKKSWAFQIPLNTAGLDILEKVNVSPDLTTLYLQCHENLDSQRPIKYHYNITNQYIDYLSINSTLNTQFNVNLEGMCSLKELYLENCLIKPEWFESLPESLMRLSIKQVRLTNSNCCTIKLPTHLHLLFIIAREDALTTFKISNVNQLDNLSDVSIFIRDSVCSNTQLKSFIHSLPESVTHLGFESEWFDDEIYGAEKLRRQEKLKLNDLHCLKDFFFSINDTDYNVSDLPPSLYLELKVLPELSGQLFSGLEFLNVNLWSYGESFGNWNFLLTFTRLSWIMNKTHQHSNLVTFLIH
ncbi:unnamed protein product [Ambrosiozyma monospora]|uniref:Unnamed protein product n=1 Tax=Ambrosiozyma monospora TaxID=43982 RepID=A0A9W7DGF6_AMBMO|nr:unnamed protein product [Ambrosiozyma monospora]